VADYAIAFDGGQLSEPLRVAYPLPSIVAELVFGERPVETRPSPLKQLVGCRNRPKHERKIVLLERA
jgi:hypothetical protein